METARPIIQVTAAIIERDGAILIAQRNVHDRMAGLWEFPGGKIGPDESAYDALARELAEEALELLP